MLRKGWIPLVPAIVLACALGTTGCSKKPKPPVEVPGEEGAAGKPPQAETPSQPIRPETPPESPGGAGAAAVELEDIFFDFDRANLRPDALDAMERNARALEETPGIRLVLEGHCDERGTTEYNLALGEKRAKAAREFLVRYGIDASRLRVVSYGEERPFDPGHDEAAWAKNRRVHFVVEE